VDSNLQTTLFYSLSAVAQTLAAAMGLIGAIALFALQGTARRIERAAKRMLDDPDLRGPEHMLLRHLFARRAFRELADRGQKYLEPGRETNVALLEHHSALMWELEHDTMLRRSFWTALVASGLVIAMALVGIATAPQLASRAAVGRTTLAVLTTSALGCLVLYGMLLRVMLATPDQLNTRR
jgi:hypothetical protein